MHYVKAEGILRQIGDINKVPKREGTIQAMIPVPTAHHSGAPYHPVMCMAIRR